MSGNFEEVYHFLYFLNNREIHTSKPLDHIGHTKESIEKRALHHAPKKFDYFKIEKRFYLVNKKFNSTI